jgi:trigger factor
MKLDITELGPTKRVLKIEVPEEEVSKRFQQAYTALNRQVRVPGFRPGKAPLALLEKRYAKTIEEDVARQLMPDYYEQAVRQAGIEPVLVEIPPMDRIKIKKNAPFSFTATVEIKPKIQLRDYKAPNPISLKPDRREVTDEQLNEALDALREQQAQLHAAPPGSTLQEGSYAVLDVEGFVDLAPLEGAKKEGHLHKLGAKLPVLGLEIDQQLIGKKEGDFIEVSQPFPATHPDSRLAGKTVVFRIKVSAIKQKQLPALDDEFAKDCGPYQSLTELKDKLQQELEAALKTSIEESYKDQVLKRLTDMHHFEIPETLIERELSAILRQHLQSRRQVRSEFGDPAKQTQEIKRLMEENRPEAARRVKIGLILEAVAQKEGLAVDEADMAAEIQRLARELKVQPEEIRRMLEAGGEESRDELRGRILYDKALDFVYRHAVIQG